MVIREGRGTLGAALGGKNISSLRQFVLSLRALGLLPELGHCILVDKPKMLVTLTVLTVLLIQKRCDTPRGHYQWEHWDLSKVTNERTFPFKLLLLLKHYISLQRLVNVQSDSVDMVSSSALAGINPMCMTSQDIPSPYTRTMEPKRKAKAMNCLASGIHTKDHPFIASEHFLTSKKFADADIMNIEGRTLGVDAKAYDAYHTMSVR